MAEHKSSSETWDAYNELWQTYYRFTPQNEHERLWYTQSLTRLNQLGDHRRLRLLSSRSGGIPAVMWGVLIGAGAITIGFSYLFGTKNTGAQTLMTAGLAMTIALVLPSILALEQPFAGITRVEPGAFDQLAVRRLEPVRSQSAPLAGLMPTSMGSPRILSKGVRLADIA